MLCTFEPMIAAIILAVFLAGAIVLVFILFTFGIGLAMSVLTELARTAHDIAFAVFICTAVLAGCLWINASAVTSDKPLGIAGIRFEARRFTSHAMTVLTVLASTAHDIVFAVFICTAVLAGCLWIDASTVALDESWCLAGFTGWRIGVVFVASEEAKGQ